MTKQAAKPATKPAAQKEEPPSSPTTPLNVLIVGPSGAGKSTSLRNLDPKKTVIVNAESKRLPFPGERRFRQIVCPDWSSLLEATKQVKEDRTAKVVVFDSFTAISEIIFDHVEGTTSDKREVYGKYATTLERFVRRSKNLNRDVIFTAIEDSIEDGEKLVKRCKVAGQKLRGSIEKEFTVVLWAVPRMKGDEVEYTFCTQTDGTTSAKSPMGMFSERHIPNDMAAVLKRAEEYYSAEG